MVVRVKFHLRLLVRIESHCCIFALDHSVADDEHANSMLLKKAHWIGMEFEGVT